MSPTAIRSTLRAFATAALISTFTTSPALSEKEQFQIQEGTSDLLCCESNRDSSPQQEDLATQKPHDKEKAARKKFPKGYDLKLPPKE